MHRHLFLSFLILLASILPTQAEDSFNERLTKIEESLEKLQARTKSKASENTAMAVYGSFRPVLTLEDDGEDTALDVRDALSHIGLKGQTRISEDLLGFFNGQWQVNIQDEGDIDGRQLAFVGLEKQWQQLTHEISLGTLRPPQYHLIAAPNDVFHHANSPFAYNAVSPFYIDNALAYRMSYSRLNFYAALSSDGRRGEDITDLLNYGVGFQQGTFAIGLALLESTQPGAATDDPGDEFQIQAISIGWSQQEIMLALAWQDFEVSPEGVAAETDGATLDLSVVYSFLPGYQLKAGYFEYEDGISDANSLGYQGVNLTLEQALAANIQLHIALLHQEPYEADSQTAISLGMRYDFNSLD